MTGKTNTLKTRSRSVSRNSQKSTWDKVKEVFVNSTISAAMAENPAVMTAAGWRKDAKTGKMSQKQTAATDKLAENLGVISRLAAQQNKLNMPHSLEMTYPDLGQYNRTAFEQELFDKISKGSYNDANDLEREMLKFK